MGKSSLSPSPLAHSTETSATSVEQPKFIYGASSVHTDTHKPTLLFLEISRDALTYTVGIE